MSLLRSKERKLPVSGYTFDYGASFSLKAQDRLSKNLGVASAFLFNKDYGRPRTIKIKMGYPSLRPSNIEPGKEPQVPRPGGGTIARAAGGGSLIVEELKFEITYRIDRVTTSAPIKKGIHP